jgi:hypothetical protein
VARPFEKFFNFADPGHPETLLPNLPKDVEATWLDKLDGSLGVLYSYPNGIADPAGTTTGIASKGSFTSDYAVWATVWYHQHVLNPIWPFGCTPVFEMICQAIQTHVVLYDIPDQLILTAIINNETGEELDYNMLWHYGRLNGLAVAEIFNFNKGLQAAYQADNIDRPNKEGYVASWPRPGQPPLKIKFKHKTFLRLQKIVHAATPKKILEALVKRDYDTLQAWEDGLSFELAEYVRKWKDQFTEAYGRILVRARLAIGHGHDEWTRKDHAKFILMYYTHVASVAFAMLDGQDQLERNLEKVSDAAWKIVAEDFKDELLKVRDEEN